MTTGFFQLSGHRIPRELQQSLFKASAAFFSLSMEEKLKLERMSAYGNTGYEAFPNAVRRGDALPHGKEVRDVQFISWCFMGGSN